MKKKTVKKITLTKETLRALSDSATQAVGGILTGMLETCNLSCATDVSCRTCQGSNCDTVHTTCC